MKMREILFRGQTRKYGEKVLAGSGEKLPGKWVYGGIFPGEGDFSIIYGWEDGVERTGGNLKTLTVYSDTVGEYAAQIDKNGTKIFEGDICRHRSVAGGKVLEDDVGDVFLYHGSWTLRDKFGYIAIGQCSPNDLEVIGNIHDNPELLEEGKYETD